MKNVDRPRASHRLQDPKRIALAVEGQHLEHGSFEGNIAAAVGFDTCRALAIRPLHRQVEESGGARVEIGIHQGRGFAFPLDRRGPEPASAEPGRDEFTAVLSWTRR